MKLGLLSGASLLCLMSPALAQQAGPVSQMPFASTPFNGSEILYTIQNGISTKTPFSTLESQFYATLLSSNQTVAGTWNFTNPLTAAGFNVPGAGSFTSPDADLGGAPIGRLTICNSQSTLGTACGYLSAYTNSQFPGVTPLEFDYGSGNCSLSPTAAPNLSALVLADATTVNSRYEFWICDPPGTGPDGYFVSGTPGGDSFFATQWDPGLNSPNGAPRTLHIGLGSSSGVQPLVPGLTIAPFMNGATVAEARVGIGPGSATSPAGMLHVNDPSASSFSQEIFDGSASSNGENIQLIGNGVTTPNKYIRTLNGVFQILSNAYSALFTLDDSGNLTVLGSIKSFSGIFAVPPTTWSDTQTCTAGQATWDANYIYVCTATDVVKRVALSSF